MIFADQRVEAASELGEMKGQDNKSIHLSGLHLKHL